MFYSAGLLTFSNLVDFVVQVADLPLCIGYIGHGI